MAVDTFQGNTADADRAARNASKPAAALQRTADGAPLDPPLAKGSTEHARHAPISKADKRDEGTPDAWVQRHPELIRLTGRHPFNCEPPLETSMSYGFITPASLHYVRNHGAVPRIKWNEHRLTVDGLCSRPRTFTMDEVLELPSTAVTATLVCAGNRRKEQNMVKKTIGFNWGHSGTSCGEWTGVRLADVLRLCGVKEEDAGSLHVRFRGPKGELPQGDDGSYGTSVPLYKALDPANDIILAYRHNGRLLTPDHGYPLRIIIPGYIGGRMVKWLEAITIAATEDQSFYHFHDNRVLPSHVDADLAKAEGWWYKPDFIINELNINSAVCWPAHNEVAAITAAGSSYRVKGYAYAGGGRKVIRCELSLDDGKSWMLADIKRAVPPTRSGRHWAWVLWELDVSLLKLLRTPEFMVRAWDESMSTQPNSFTWNVMGMMNNCCYRVKVHPVGTTSGSLALKFEHPTLAGPTAGGWMSGGDAQVPAVEAPVLEPVEAGGGRSNRITMAEVEKHDTKESAWFVSNGKVIDATAFLKDHPGGAESILLSAGTDASEEFAAIHSDKAKKQLLQYVIGDLAIDSRLPGITEKGDADVPALAEDAASASSGQSEDGRLSPTVSQVKTSLLMPNCWLGHLAERRDCEEFAAYNSPLQSSEAPVALNPKKRIHFKLLSKAMVSHNVRRFRFALQSPQHKFGLPVGKHVFIYAQVNSELVMRAYTPTSSDNDLGYFDLVIKVYWKNEHPRFPEGGKMSQALESLAVGDSIEVKGPLGHFQYQGQGCYSLDGAQHSCRHISMIAGGTGITPVYQVIKAVLRSENDPVCLRLLYANQAPDDVLLFEELQAMAAADARFEIWYTVDRPTPDWAYSSGFITEEMVRERLFSANEETICLMCGPPPMIKFACMPNLEKAGYAADKCIQF